MNCRIPMPVQLPFAKLAILNFRRVEGGIDFPYLMRFAAIHALLLLGLPSLAARIFARASADILLPRNI